MAFTKTTGRAKGFLVRRHRNSGGRPEPMRGFTLGRRSPHSQSRKGEAPATGGPGLLGFLGGTSDGEGSPSHKNQSNILYAFSNIPLCRAAPVLPRLPGPLTMISRDGIHGGTVTVTKPGNSAGLFLSPALLVVLAASSPKKKPGLPGDGGRLLLFYALTLCPPLKQSDDSLN
jgi:hypothetical protein